MKICSGEYGKIQVKKQLIGWLNKDGDNASSVLCHCQRERSVDNSIFYV